MGEGPFDDDEQEKHRWQQLPLVPAVTGVLLRQQNRRRWKPTALAQMFARLPRLQEIHYEPWREWIDIQQLWTDKSNYGDSYPLRISIKSTRLDFPIRTPTPDVSRVVANASLELEHLSASFMVDASYFFCSREPSWKWPNLTSLALTSRLFAPDESPIERSTTCSRKQQQRP
ncbi:hypothetical protein DTO166G4_4529 [Paecilomyces variotii]|nr:hypothetical protein DTO166G4_4529 [Paecilomyces variotii]KAJ9240030.1 hypothetical protein DTO166G5_1895 [Paecilomyces variotii]